MTEIILDRAAATALINTHVQAAYAELKKAQGISDLTGISFDFELTYGAGATYYPEKFTRENALSLIESGIALTAEQRSKIADVLRNPDEYGDDEWASSNTGWQSSSSMC
jgi:hypothetical protein